MEDGLGGKLLGPLESVVKVAKKLDTCRLRPFGGATDESHRRCPGPLGPIPSSGISNRQ